MDSEKIVEKLTEIREELRVSVGVLKSQHEHLEGLVLRLIEERVEKHDREIEAIKENQTASNTEIRTSIATAKMFGKIWLGVLAAVNAIGIIATVIVYIVK